MNGHASQRRDKDTGALHSNLLFLRYEAVRKENAERMDDFELIS